MIPIILSGGSGSRLWPLSRKSRPKQFMPLIGTKTMLQHTIERLPEGSVDPILVCNQDHCFIVDDQLQQINRRSQVVIVEPVGRNTAPALALAAMYVVNGSEAGRAGNEADEILLVLPADHHIGETATFHAVLKQAEESARAGRLVLFGIRPTHPETGYGYVRSGARVDGAEAAIYSVAQFVEKPDRAKAENYLAAGDYLWNSGIFMLHARVYLAELKRLRPDIYAACKNAFDNIRYESGFAHVPESFAHCPSDSIDYAVMEHTDRAVVVALDAGWNDVGTWSALWDIQEKNEEQNVFKGDVVAHASRGCLVAADGRLVSLLGVSDLVVVDTRDAVLIAHRDRVQDVKELVGRLDGLGRAETSLHREVSRPWGSYDSVDRGERFQVKRIRVKPGGRLSLQKHHHRAEHWIVVQGTALVTCGERQFLLSENESTYIPIGEIHRLENPGKIPLEIIEVQSGCYLGEDDIVRLEDNYGRAPVPAAVEEPADDADSIITVLPVTAVGAPLSSPAGR
ncbi:MAG TPA: mannose-1-phosphate guanylyltransferase/mannose-6-phosphate isomerase [Gammaproteobacteria bacterium]|nr:mannose-1-phosphate guanylyltransferase/mannose-6-phosphate isomerase [Gammaproteobacteria bacterium]